MNNLILSNKNLNLKQLHRLLNFDSSMKSINTANMYTCLIQKFNRYLEVQGIQILEVNKQVIIDYMSYCRESGEKKQSVNNNIKAIKRFYRMLKDKGHINVNPCDGVKYYKEENWSIKNKWLDTPVLETIFELLKNDSKEITQRDYAIVFTLMSTGLRASELCNLKFENIIYRNGQPAELKVIDGKGGKDRTVEINYKIVKSILEYRKEAGLEVTQDDYIFYTVPNNRFKERNPLTRITLFYIIQRLGEKIGIKKLSPHKFRHTFITHLLKNGCPIHLVQEAAGHSSINTTIVYTHDDSPYLGYLNNLQNLVYYP